MDKSQDLEEREAEQGERMIEVKVRFWTNNIAEGKGIILPKHAWSSGVVRMEKNTSHGIIPKSPVVFHTLMDLPSVIERVLIEHEIILHRSRKMKKYFDTSRPGKK